MSRLLICDDQIIVVEGLRSILNSAPDIEVVGQAYNGLEAVEEVEKLRPDVVLMDLRMPRMNGIHAIRKIRSAYFETHVLVLTAYDSDEWIDGAVRAGADGYILKDAPPDQLFAAIRSVAKGIPYLAPDITRKVLDLFAQTATRVEPAEDFSLSDREIEVLSLMAKGSPTAYIARTLSLSEDTVRNHVSSAVNKLNAYDRTQAVVLAICYGFIDTQ